MKKQLLFIFCIISIGLTAQLPSITNQPITTTVSVGANTTYSINATGTITGYQWQVSSNGGVSYNDISIAGINPIYSGWTSNTLTVSGIPLMANGNMYRCIVFGSSTSNVETLTTPGSGSWTCPLGITSVTVQCWGAGGAGGSCPGGYMQNCSGGGGGGAFSSSTIVVSPGVSYPYTIGSGGTVTSTNGNSGGLTSFNNSTITASGGNGGGWRAPDGYNPGGAGGTGGLISNSVGTIKYNGGIGNSGTIGYCGGGGGGSAGTTGNGSNAPGGINWNGGSGSSQFGGNGGHGGSWADRGTYSGENGNSFGGGGGGSSNSNWSSNQTYGGNGANGAIKIGYNSSSSVISNSVMLTVVSPPTITTTASPTLINCGGSTTLTASSTSATQPCTKADLPATLQNGLVGYWPFCGNANDISDNANHGTIYGATLTSDRFGNANSAYSFDGVNDYISISNSLFTQGPFSFSGWVYSNDNSYFNPIVGFGELGGPNTNRLYIASPFAQIGTEGMNDISSATSFSVSTGWHHWVVNINAYNVNAVSFYCDGQLLTGNTTNGANIPFPLNNVGFTFGKHTGSSTTTYANAILDDISIYNRALSASEIQQLYTLGNVNYSWSPSGATSPTITVSPTQTTTYTCTASNTAGSTTSSVTVTVADTLTWLGQFDTDWHKPCNWSPQFVPQCCNNVLVPFTSNQPVVSGIAAAEDVTINSTSGAVIRVNAGANLQVGVCPITITQTACPSLAVITTTAVSSITQATAISGGTISYQGASAITARGICWSTSANPTLANSFTTNGTGVGTFTANLTGLTAGTTYYVRAFATNASGTSYGNEVSFSTQTLAAQYPAGSVFCAAGPTAIVDVTNPTTGKTWMDRNLGASQVATSSTDAAAYGDLYQWGRGTDGHQCRTSATTSTLSSSDQPGNGNFILAPNSPWDWRNSQNSNLWQGVNGVNNPCPSGYRLPTEIEFDNERLSWSSNSELGAIGSLIKLPSTGYRNGSGGMLAAVGSFGYYWVSTLLAAASKDIYFGGGNAGTQSSNRANGISVRCIKDAAPIPATIGAINCNSTSVTGTVTAGVAASNVTIAVPYIGANGGYYGLQTISSMGVNGLSATLAAGVIANGAGSLSLVVSGTPSTSGIADFPVNIGGQSCSISVTVNALTTQYAAGSVFCSSGPTAIVDVTNPTTGKTWMDRNLGASQVATSATDAAAYGDLYQWGRGTDGHQCRTSTTTTTLSSSDQPGHGNFIIVTTAPNDWRSPQNSNLWQGVNGVNNPCPTGYRLPTEFELNEESLTWSTNNSMGAFSSVLKLTLGGLHDHSVGLIFVDGVNGYYWTSSINGSNSRSRNIENLNAYWYSTLRGYALSVRCIKN